MGKDEIQDTSNVEGRLNNLSSEEIQIIEKGASFSCVYPEVSLAFWIRLPIWILISLRSFI